MKLIAAISLLLTTRCAAESGSTSLGCDPIGGSNFASRFEACGTYEECEGECVILVPFFSSLMTTIETDPTVQSSHIQMHVCSKFKPGLLQKAVLSVTLTLHSADIGHY